MASVHLCFIRLPDRQLTVASLLYASPAWWGLATAEDKSQMERLLGRLRRGGYLPADFPSVEILALAADHQLFVSIASKPYHVLGGLYYDLAELLDADPPSQPKAKKAPKETRWQHIIMSSVPYS